MTIIDWEENKRLLALLEPLAKKMKWEIGQLIKFAQTMAQGERDPLPPQEWGDVHEDWTREPIFKDDDFSPTMLVNVPKPNAQVILVRARREYRNDLRTFNEAMASGVSSEWEWRIQNQFIKWLRFWAVRWPDPEFRVELENSLPEEEAKLAKLQERRKH